MGQLRTFTVSLSCLVYTAGSGVCLVPVAHACLVAETPLRAVYSFMREAEILFVDHVEVLLADGSRLVWKSLLAQGVYDVALWPSSSTTALPLVLDRARAVSPLQASLLAMQHYQRRFVDRVSVACPGGSTWSRGALRRVEDEREEKRDE